MATIPRYQELGVQYADLPKVSTALQQARATGFDQLSRSLDRMTTYLQGERETQVKKEAAKYAVDNPITSEQLEAALKDPKALQIEGAGQVFQETYQAYAAAQLSSELQLQASTALKKIELNVENGQMDALAASVEMQDLLDGQSALMAAVSPEYAVKHRAALATMSATSRNKVYDFGQKKEIGVIKATLELGLQDLPKRIEDVLIQNADSIEPGTAAPVDLAKMVAAELAPYAASVSRLGGDNTYYKEALKAVDTARVNALVSKLKDRDFSPDATTALSKFRKGDFGSLTRVFNSLDDEQKAKVRKKVLESYKDEQSAAEADQQLTKRANEEKATTLKLEFLKPNVSTQRRRQIASNLVELGAMTLPQAVSMMKEPDATGNVELFLQINDKISRGTLTSIGELAQYRDRLSDAEYKSLGMAITTREGKEAMSILKIESGIRENEFNPIDIKQKFKGLKQEYVAQLGVKVPNEQGVMVEQTPSQAAEAAVKKWNSSARAKEIEKITNRANKELEALLKGKRVTLPNLPLEQIDFSKLGLDDDIVDRANTIVNNYKRRLER